MITCRRDVSEIYVFHARHFIRFITHAYSRMWFVSFVQNLIEIESRLRRYETLSTETLIINLRKLDLTGTELRYT